MKKAVIATGSKQYLVSEGDIISVELIPDVKSKVVFDTLLYVENKTILVGTPTVDKHTVAADVLEADTQAEKVTSIRYKAKKRVHTVRGHRQHHTVLKIAKIS